MHTHTLVFFVILHGTCSCREATAFYTFTSWLPSMFEKVHKMGQNVVFGGLMVMYALM